MTTTSSLKLRAAGVCGTDAHEYKNDPFGLIPVVLGHEGTGEIVKMGKNVKVDTAGKPVKVGDKIVTCMIFKDDPEITMFDLNKKNVAALTYMDFFRMTTLNSTAGSLITSSSEAENSVPHSLM